MAQHRAEHRVVVVPIVETWTQGHPFGIPLVRAGVPIEPFETPPRSYIRERRMLIERLSTNRPDVIHTHGYHADVVAALAARRLGLPMVTTVHGFTGGPWRNRVYEYVDCLAFRRFDAVAAVSAPLAATLLRSGVPESRLHVVQNAWGQLSQPLDRTAARRALQLPPDEFVAAWVGRVSREKGLDVLIEALPSVADLPLRLCVVGDGPERAGCAEQALRLGVHDKVRWAGRVNEAGQYFAAFDAFVLSSRTEGVPMVLFEAMAAKVPIVATAVGGVPSVLGPEEAHLTPSDRPDALASAIRRVVTDGPDARRRAAAAAKRLEVEFGEPAWLARYDAVYEAAISRHSRGPVNPSGLEQ